MRHWLLKSEPEVFSFDDLWKAAKRTTSWGGVRNYQARNLLRDELARGDLVLFYHSSTEPSGVAGLARVVRPGYPDPTQFEPGPARDPKSSRTEPRWYAVDVQALGRLLTTIGSQQQCDIYLFKDSSIAPQQATIELRGTQAYFRSATPVYVAGIPTQSKVLLSGDSIQIGRYAFRYNERHRS